MEAVYRPAISPLQLDRYFLKSLHFQLRPGFDSGIRGFTPAPPNIEVGVVCAEQDPGNPKQWRFEVRIELPDEPSDGGFPYTIETTLVGFFTVSPHYPQETTELLARANGPALLYSCAREILASITGRSPYPKLTIPSVTFIQPELLPREVSALSEMKPKQLGPAGGLREVDKNG